MSYYVLEVHVRYHGDDMRHELSFLLLDDCITERLHAERGSRRLHDDAREQATCAMKTTVIPTPAENLAFMQVFWRSARTISDELEAFYQLINLLPHCLGIHPWSWACYLMHRRSIFVAVFVGYVDIDQHLECFLVLEFLHRTS